MQREQRRQRLFDQGILTHAGYMTKQGGVRKNWKRRWFQLQKEGTELAYFESEGGESSCLRILSVARREMAPHLSRRGLSRSRPPLRARRPLRLPPAVA